MKNKYLTRLNELRDSFRKRFAAFTDAVKERETFENQAIAFRDRNKRYSNGTLKDYVLTLVFIFIILSMWLLDYQMIGELVDLIIDQQKLGATVGYLIKIILSLIFLAVQLMSVVHNKRLEEEYEKHPGFKPRGLLVSRLLKIVPPLVLYAVVLVYKMMVALGSGDLVYVLASLFGFVSMFILAVSGHLILSFRGRWMLESFGRTVYNVRHRNLGNKLIMLMRAEDQRKEKVCKAFEVLERHHRDCGERFPDDDWTLRFTREEEDFLRAQYRFRERTESAHSIPNS